MAVQVFQPFEIFYDINGKPVDDGFIFIGQPNLDPVTNPVSVFFDEALTIPAAQPIRTRNGFPANAGVQAQVFVAETTFSISIKNKNSTVIRSVAAAKSATDLEARLRDAVNPLNGANIPGWARKDLTVAVANAPTLQRALEASSVCLWEFIHLITDRPNPSDMATWDWGPAVNGCARFIADNYVQGGLTYGKSMYVPALGLTPGYLLKTPVLIPRGGINIIGEGSLSSVFRVDASLAGTPYVWIIRNEVPSGSNTGGVCFHGVGLDMNGVDAGGISWEDAYDAVLVNDLRVSMVHSGRIGYRMGPRTDGNPGQPLSQTISVRNLFVYKTGAGATVPPVALYKVQEAQFIGCKAWAGGYAGAGRGNTSAWYLEDCRSVDLLGCSAVGAQDHGVHVRAETKQIAGIRLRGMLYENCNGRTKTSTSNSATFPILSFYHDLARIESPVSGGFSLGGLNGGYVDVDTSSATIEADSTQVVVHTQHLPNVTDSGTNNVVWAHPNAIVNVMALNKQLRVVQASTPRFALGRPDTADITFWDWNSNSGSDLGARLGFVKGGVTTTCAIFNEAPASSQSSMQLLINDGAVTSVRRVTVGAVDSGGVGFRVLRVPN